MLFWLVYLYLWRTLSPQVCLRFLSGSNTVQNCSPVIFPRPLPRYYSIHRLAGLTQQRLTLACTQSSFYRPTAAWNLYHTHT